MPKSQGLRSATTSTDEAARRAVSQVAAAYRVGPALVQDTLIREVH